MASTGYNDWLKAGRPYALIRPARDLQTALRRYGLTVYDYPDEEHLKAPTPEDHTPFSVTGWPGPNARWKARGLDVMPRSDSKAHRKENADLARQLIADRNAGVPGVMWIKYINWTDESGVCRQERWTPNHTTRTSTDKGHIHISGRSDADADTRAADYDPIQRMLGIATSKGGDMNLSDGSPWAAQFTTEPGIDGPWLGGQMGNQLQYVREDAYFARKLAARTDARLAALSVVIESLAAAIKAGGGSVDTQAILAGVDERLAKLAAETRDAVADLGEGGAAQVRADAE